MYHHMPTDNLVHLEGLVGASVNVRTVIIHRNASLMIVKQEVPAQNYWIFGLCSSSCILTTRKQRFGNWICFHSQVIGVRHVLCWVS
jgi:hypothetical protein